MTDHLRHLFYDELADMEGQQSNPLDKNDATKGAVPAAPAGSSWMQSELAPWERSRLERHIKYKGRRGLFFWTGEYQDPEVTNPLTVRIGNHVYRNPNYKEDSVVRLHSRLTDYKLMAMEREVKTYPQYKRLQEIAEQRKAEALAKAEQEQSSGQGQAQSKPVFGPSFFGRNPDGSYFASLKDPEDAQEERQPGEDSITRGLNQRDAPWRDHLIFLAGGPETQPPQPLPPLQQAQEPQALDVGNEGVAPVEKSTQRVKPGKYPTHTVGKDGKPSTVMVEVGEDSLMGQNRAEVPIIKEGCIVSSDM